MTTVFLPVFYKQIGSIFNQKLNSYIKVTGWTELSSKTPEIISGHARPPVLTLFLEFETLIVTLFVSRRRGCLEFVSETGSIPTGRNVI